MASLRSILTASVSRARDVIVLAMNVGGRVRADAPTEGRLNVDQDHVHRTVTSIDLTERRRRNLVNKPEGQMLKSALVIGISLILLRSAAMAQEPGTLPACVGDIQKLCAERNPAKGGLGIVQSSI